MEGKAEAEEAGSGAGDEAYGERESQPWRHWIGPIITWAAQDPWNFIGNVMLMLSPLIFICMYLSFKLLRNLENQKKDKKKKIKRDSKGKRKKNKDG